MSEIPARCVELTFADRVSFAIFDEAYMVNLQKEQMKQLAEKFYNDTYLMDQNACSSPHLILWQNCTKDHAGRRLFWSEVVAAAEKYDLPEKKVLDKYTMLCEQAALTGDIIAVNRFKNRLYVAELKGLPERIEDYRGKFGLFYETDIRELEEICESITPKIQTCVTYGVDHQKLQKILMEHHVQGVDRIVSVGDAMNLGMFWDGYDVIGSMSRGIVV